MHNFTLETGIFISNTNPLIIGRQYFISSLTALAYNKIVSICDD